MKSVAIENASVEMLELFERVSAESKIEKNAVPPTNKMIYYWTRKPLIVGRAVALACTLDSPKDVERFLRLDVDGRAYKSSPNQAEYAKALGRNPSDIKVLDPFAGTGNLAFPAAELGLDVTCSDYNPLAYLISKGSLEIPAASDSGLAEEFGRVATKIIDEVKEEVGQFYKPQYFAYMWAWCIRCTHCSQRMPLLNQMYLSVKNGVGLKITPTTDKNFTVDIVGNMSKEEGRSYTHKLGKVQCISCHNTISYDDMTHDITKNRDREMIAIQIQGPGKRGRKYISPTEDDLKQYHRAVQYFKHSDMLDLIPKEKILASHRKRNTLWIYGIETWNEFFSDRQLLILSTLMKKIETFCKESNNSHIPALRLYLSFLVARFVDLYSYGVLWDPGTDKLAPALSMRQPRIVFNSVEANPFEKARGSIRNTTSNIVKGIEFCARHLETPATCNMESVTAPSKQQYDIIITDPPYGDDVQYGELSEFLYLWMYRILKNGGDSLPARAPLDEDFCESQGRFGDKKIASEFFEQGLKKSFMSINRKMKDDGLLAVFFAHSTIRAWNQLLAALRAGGLRVVSSYALHTESTNNPLAHNKASFMSSIVVVCRKITGNASGFIEDIIPDTEDGIEDTLSRIPNDKLLTLPITDLLIMVYGKVLESCTRYRTLKSRSGDRDPDFEMMLFNAQSVVMRLLVSRLTKSSVNTIGPTMAFYILVKVFQNGAATADEMHKITKAYNVEPAVLAKSGVVAGNGGGAYRLTHLHKNEMDFPPENVERDNLHQQLCYLARKVDAGKTKSIDGILDGENFRRSTLKQVIRLLLQGINMQKTRGKSLNEDDRNEMRVLGTLADVMGVRSEKGGLEAFESK